MGSDLETRAREAAEETMAGIAYVEAAFPGECDIAHAWADSHARAMRAEAVRALEEALADVDKSWSFNANQGHTHTWHEKQDCLERLRAAAAKYREVE